jgi:hypothetical protein
MDVVAYLEKLPSMAWPYGLVVAVQENGVRARGDDARIKRNREELVRLLEKWGKSGPLAFKVESKHWLSTLNSFRLQQPVPINRFTENCSLSGAFPTVHA